MSRESKRRYKKKNKEASYRLIREIKTSGECLRCSRLHSDELPLEFHHRDPKKKKNVVCKLASKGNSLKTILKEIEKCDLVCETCHTRIHK